VEDGENKRGWRLFLLFFSTPTQKDPRVVALIGLKYKPHVSSFPSCHIILFNFGSGYGVEVGAKILDNQFGIHEWLMYVLVLLFKSLKPDS
jgi:hypothetical protein